MQPDLRTWPGAHRIILWSWTTCATSSHIQCDPSAARRMTQSQLQLRRRRHFSEWMYEKTHFGTSFVSGMFFFFKSLCRSGFCIFNIVGWAVQCGGSGFASRVIIEYKCSGRIERMRQDGAKSPIFIAMPAKLCFRRHRDICWLDRVENKRSTLIDATL